MWLPAQIGWRSSRFRSQPPMHPLTRDLMPGPGFKRGVVLGLVGSVCAGKSTVGRLLEKRGAGTYQADAVVRALYDQTDVKQAVRVLFGDDVFDVHGAVDRSAIARRIFRPHGDP